MRLSLAPLTRQSIDRVLAHLSADDRAELAAAGSRDWSAVFGAAAETADLAGAVEVEGLPIAVWGVNRSGEHGVPWMVATDEVRQYRREFLALSVAVFAAMCDRFGVLVNLVHADHVRAIRWLTWLGCTVHREPVGPGGRFYRFTKEAQGV